MKKSASTELAENEPTYTQQFHTPNAEGIFEQFETINITIGHGNICHLLVAHSSEGYIAGRKLFTRQPHNLVMNLPRAGDDIFLNRESVIISETRTAIHFFSQHRASLQRIAQWLVEKLPAQIVTAIQGALAADGDKVGFGPLLDEALKVSSGEPVAPPPTAPDMRPDSEVPADELAKREEFREAVAAATAPRTRYDVISVDDIERGDNPRKSRSETALQELVESIRAQGELLQPIAVRDMGEGRGNKPDTKRYRLIFGEGRWLAVQQLGWTQIDAKVYIGLNADDALAKALVENLQREDMNAMDEAEGFADLSRLGWKPARMAEQTGKGLSTIQAALALMKLPDAVRAQVRSGDLSARQARVLVRWVSASNNAGVDFVARPRVCEIIAEIAGKKFFNISSDRLADDCGVPLEALSTLIEEKLLVEIPSKYQGAREDDMPGAFMTEGRVFTFEIEKWKAAKKRLDAEAREAAAAVAEKAQTKVTNQVSVPVAELKKGNVAAVELVGDLEIYAEYLPPAAVVQGIAESQAEVMVCLQPEMLKLLRGAEAKSISESDWAVIVDARTRASAKIRKLKKVGAHEMYFLLGQLIAADRNDVRDGWALQVWNNQGVKLPAGFVCDSTEWASRSLAKAKLPELALVRVCLEAAIAANLMRDDLISNLCWILDVPKLGLIEDDPNARRQLLARLSAELWPAAAAPIARTLKSKKRPSKKPAKGKKSRK